MKRGLGYYVRSAGFALKLVTTDNTHYNLHLPCQVGPKGRYIVPEITAIEVQWPQSQPGTTYSDTAAASEFHGSMVDSLLFRSGRGLTDVGIQWYDQLKEATCIDVFARGRSLHLQVAKQATAADMPYPFSFEADGSCKREVHDLAALGNGEGRVLASGSVMITARRYANTASTWITPSVESSGVFADYVFGKIYFRMRLLNMAEYQFIQAKTNNQSLVQEDVKWNDNEVALAYVAPDPSGTVWAVPTM